jgi:hypothetical protein
MATSWWSCHPAAWGDVIYNRESTGRITKWGLELMGLDITYTPRTVIKSQFLTDFMAK